MRAGQRRQYGPGSGGSTGRAAAVVRAGQRRQYGPDRMAVQRGLKV
ncbi:MAG: hypothetical protein FWG03_00970 [Clostridiales bacterium]|nr:hypothetical protein [Clostridiales bacterium]